MHKIPISGLERPFLLLPGAPAHEIAADGEERRINDGPDQEHAEVQPDLRL